MRRVAAQAPRPLIEPGQSIVTCRVRCDCIPAVGVSGELALDVLERFLNERDRLIGPSEIGMGLGIGRGVGEEAGARQLSGRFQPRKELVRQPVLLTIVELSSRQ
jgi:hypothetical protein